MKLDISEDPVINAYGGPDGIQINLALAELLADSESELAFLIGHELGHVYQFRTEKRIFDPNRELDADVWGLFLSLLAGYDPYAVAGTLAKMVMANGQADLQSQYTLEFSRISEHGSFNNRLDHIYDIITDFCSSDVGFEVCNLYREIFHPHLPGGRFLTVEPQAEMELPDRTKKGLRIPGPKSNQRLLPVVPGGREDVSGIGGVGVPVLSPPIMRE